MVGAHFRIDPEFFRRHISFIESKQHFDLPTLPSTSSHILQLPLITIGTRTTGVAPKSGSIELRRESARLHVQEYLQNLKRDPAVGQSIIRDVLVQDDSYFTIEQDVSIYVQQRSGSWLAVVWTDCGRAISRKTLGPWTRILDAISFLPVFQHKHKVFLGNDEPSLNLSDTNEGLLPPSSPPTKVPPLLSCDMFQSAVLLQHANGQTLDPLAMLKDVCYGLNEVFAFVAFSSMQYLNLIAHVLNDERSVITHELDLKRMDSSFATLQHLQASLALQNTKLTNIVKFIKSHGGPNSLGASPETHAREHGVADAAAALLIADYEHLLERAGHLATQCADQTSLLMNRATIEIAQRGISQSEDTRWLTLLAFLFLPLGVTTGFFGMNFEEFQNQNGPKLSVWIWFVISVPIFALSCVICFWGEVKRWLQRVGRRLC